MTHLRLQADIWNKNQEPLLDKIIDNQIMNSTSEISRHSSRMSDKDFIVILQEFMKTGPFRLYRNAFAKNKHGRYATTSQGRQSVGSNQVAHKLWFMISCRVILITGPVEETDCESLKSLCSHGTVPSSPTSSQANCLLHKTYTSMDHILKPIHKKKMRNKV